MKVEVTTEFATFKDPNLRRLVTAEREICLYAPSTMTAILGYKIMIEVATFRHPYLCRLVTAILIGFATFKHPNLGRWSLQP